MCHKIVLEKDPGAPNLCAGYPPDLGALAELLWVKPKEGRSFSQAERTLSVACALSEQGTDRLFFHAGTIRIPHRAHLSPRRHCGGSDESSPEYRPVGSRDKFEAILFMPAGAP